jgi:hypothetical protein
MDYEDEEGGGEDEYEYFEVEEETEQARKGYAKHMIKESKEQDGQFKRPDYSSNLSKEEEYESKPPEEPEKEQEEPKTKEKKKEEYEL